MRLAISVLMNVVISVGVAGVLAMLGVTPVAVCLIFFIVLIPAANFVTAKVTKIDVQKTVFR